MARGLRSPSSEPSRRRRHASAAGGGSLAAGYIALAAAHADEARQASRRCRRLFPARAARRSRWRGRESNWRARSRRSTGAEAAARRSTARHRPVCSELKAELEIVARAPLLDVARVDRSRSPPSRANERSAGLTRREIEVLRLVADGLNNQTIAERLFVSDHTVHRHLANILNKLSVSSRAAAVAQAARRGLLTVSQRQQCEPSPLWPVRAIFAASSK